MTLSEFQVEVEDKAIEYLNAARLDYIEAYVLRQLGRPPDNGYVRLHKLEFSALIAAVRGLRRKVARDDE